MKNGLFLLLLFFFNLAFGQNTFNNFEGKLLFKNIHYLEPITREICDTTINFYSYGVKTKKNRAEINIEELKFHKDYNEIYKFLKIKLLRQHDSLFINYNNPTDHQEILEYIYPINNRDTVTNGSGYKICVDSILNYDHTYLKKINYCFKGPKFETTYLKDTTIIFKNYIFECYVIQENCISLRSQIHLRKNIYLEKTGLFPVYEDEWLFARRILNPIPLDKWVMTSQMKLISIE